MAARDTRRRLIRAGEWTAKVYPDVPHEYLLRLLKAPRGFDRLRGLMYLQLRIQNEGRTLALLRVAESMVPDTDNDCRWQALIAAGLFIQSHPLRIWRLIQRHGISRDDDMRTAVAVLLLEHLIDDNPAKWQVRAKRTAKRSKNFNSTLSRCWLHLPEGSTEAS